MMSRTARRILPACVISAAIAAGLAVPGAASAEFTLVQCEGGAIHGKGSSAQKLLQINVWNKQFNESANGKACNGTQGSKGKPAVTYTSTGSGPGMESWGVETKPGGEIRFGKENAFVGTEIAPNKKQSEEITGHGAAGTLLTIPVAQPAIAIAVHLPKGCEKVTGGASPGRLAMKQATVEKIFQGTVTKWSQILNKAVMTGNSECAKTLQKTLPITRVVREDGSGTTDAFMKWLGVIFKKEVAPGKFWGQLGEPANNTTWPNEGEHPVLRGNGGGGVVKKVAETPGSIGYANVADARANTAFVPPAGGTEKPVFWAEVESHKITEEGKKVAVYSDPSTNHESATIADSNCLEEIYTNGKKKFPPPTTQELWNEVVASKTQPNSYAICYITFDLALTKYSAFTVGTSVVEPPTEEEARTVRDYLGYELSTGAGGGQEAAAGNDYAKLPTNENPTLNVLKIAQEGVAKVGF
jgi:ABC-type phosphate transport system substrate-binding protein